MSRILIIEDQQLLCQLYRSALANNKHQVALTYTGEDGVAEALRDRPDLVIMDLNLPGISGEETAVALRKLDMLPEIPVIIATALGEEARPIADSVNAAALLAKPFHLNVLTSEVEKALGRLVPVALPA